MTKHGWVALSGLGFLEIISASIRLIEISLNYSSIPIIQTPKGNKKLSNFLIIKRWSETPQCFFLWQKVDTKIAKNHKVNMCHWFLDF